MKINWGTGIVLAFIGFIGFILFFVVQMSTEDRAEHDLVTEEYYKAELAYQKEIDAEENANALPEKLSLQRSVEGLLIKFPSAMVPTKIKGKVSLYRPSNKHLDFDLPISLSNSHLLIPDKRLLDGRWDIKIEWKYDSKPYMYKHSLNY